MNRAHLLEQELTKILWISSERDEYGASPEKGAAE